jgi:pyruvate-formate lyase-activating enzyme
VPMRAIWLMGCPLRCNRCVPSSIIHRGEGCPSQRMVRPVEQ